MDVVSAHRMPEEMVDYGRSAAERGLRVIVAGAGGAAHLPGMLASVTPLPVIGVPVPLTHLDGMDSLLSIVQMPAGVPVATVSIGGARNAGLLAARILGAGEGEEAARMRGRPWSTSRSELREAAQAKGRALRDTHRGDAGSAGDRRRRRRPGWTRGYSMRGQVSMTTASPASRARSAACSSTTPSWSQTASMPRRSFSAIAWSTTCTDLCAS